MAYLATVVVTDHHLPMAVKCTNSTKQNPELLQDAIHGNVDRVKKLTACNGTNVNVQDDDGRMPLYLASLKNHTQVVKFLLGLEKIDVNHGTTDNGETALIVAAKNGSAAIVGLLLSHEKVDLNKGLATTGLTPLIAASQNGHSKIVEMLIHQPLISVNKALIISGVSSLVAALKNGHNAVVEILLNHTKTNVNQAKKNGRTPLIIAVSNVNSTDSVKMLLAQPGIDVNWELFDGKTALFLAVISKHSAAVDLLLRCPKTDTDLLDENYKSAKDYASEGDLHDIVKSFETKGSLMKEKGHSCCSDSINRGLLMAVEDGHLTWVKTFLRCPQIKINVRTQHGVTPLLKAAARDYGVIPQQIAVSKEANNEIVKLLLSNPEIDVNKYNSMNGKTALIVASEEGKSDIVKMLLLNAQINVEISDIHGRTALWKAANNGYLMAVKLLLRCPKTKVDHIESKYDDIKKAIDMHAYLLKVGGTCCLNVADGLLQAATEGYYREIRGLLLCPDSNCNVIDKRGRTPLYLASLRDHNMSVQVLLEDGNIDTEIGKTLDGGTPFSIASEKGHFKVMEQLITHGNDVHVSNLNKGWCSDNWTPDITMCLIATKIEVSTVIYETTSTTSTESGNTFLIKNLF